MTSDDPREFEFDCIECGRHIIMIVNSRFYERHPNVCAACWSLPGWYNDPEMARAIDSDMRRTRFVQGEEDGDGEQGTGTT